MGATSMQQPVPGRRGFAAAAAAAGALFSVVLLEIVLRLVPGAIPPKLLLLFEPGLRERIAAGSYPIQKDFLPVERDDGGPPMFAAKPGTRIVSIDEPADGAVRVTDELGFCNPPGHGAAAARIDVVALGDSFTWCHAVAAEQAWPVLLGRRLGVEVLSLGRGGNGPYEYVQYLRRFGLDRRPRVVVLNVYGGNDLRDAEAWRDYRDAVARGEEPVAEAPRPLFPALQATWLGRHAYVLNLALSAAGRLAHHDPRDDERAGIDFRYRVGDVAFNAENRDRDEVVTARRVAAGRLSPALWDPALARFASLAREHGFAPVVTYAPSAWAAVPGRVAFADESLRPDLAALDAAQRRVLAEGAAKHGYAFHDLTADLAAAAAAGDLPYDPVHVHFSVAGNEAVAASVASFLRQKGLAPRS